MSEKYEDPIDKEDDDNSEEDGEADNGDTGDGAEPKKEESHIEKIVRARLEKKEEVHNKKMAEANARIRDLEQKVNSTGVSVPAANAGTPPTMQNGGQNPGAQQMPPAMQQAQIESAIKYRDFQAKLAEAAEKDPEFAKLIGDETRPQTGNPIHPSRLGMFAHLPNAAAVIKHLKKNNKDYAVLDSSATNHEAIKFLNEISDKLENNPNTPRPSEFEPEPDLSDVGTADQSYSAVDRWRKRKGN